MKTRTDKIVKFHNGIKIKLRQSIVDAIQIGEFLSQTNNELGHGYFLLLILNNLPFTDRRARRYMRMYQNKNKIMVNLKTNSVPDLTSPYHLLEIPKKMPGVTEYLDYIIRQDNGIDPEGFNTGMANHFRAWVRRDSFSTDNTRGADKKSE